MFRFASRAVVAITACALVAPSVRAQDASPSADSRPTVAVMHFNNGAIGKAHEELDPLRGGIADILTSELSANSGIRIIERDQLDKLVAEQNLSANGSVDKATAVRVGKLLGVHHMIFGGFIIDPRGNMRLDARAVHVETGVVEHVETVTDKADNMLAIISGVADKMNKGMKLPPMPSGAARPAVNPEGSKPGRWRDLIIYARAEDANDKKDRTRALALYKEFLDKSPTTILPAQRKRAEQKVRELAAGS
jgi:TolB-like protein